LQAIGQIAEREDLGEGPRTVIDAFKRAILCYQDQARAYTPIDLIDDFLESNIRFQAQSDKIKTVTRQALNSALVNTPEKAQAVKLMAAFPRGCPVRVQKDYNLYDAVNVLSKDYHGELMTHLAEGYTLLGLSRSEGATRTVDLVITRFWRSYEEDELHLESAIKAFISRLLPIFFQRRRGTSATGWGDLDFGSSAQGSYVALVEGSFNRRYPRRLLGLQVAYKERQMQASVGSADLQFDFLFQLKDYQEPGDLTLVSDRIVRFCLNLCQRVGPHLPDDLRKLQDFVNPEFVTPLLMLSLVDFFDRWEEVGNQALPEQDRPEVEHLISRLVDHTVSVLFGQGMVERVTPRLRRVGRLMFEEVFNRLCASLYADYHTFFVQAQYESVVNAYINAMHAMTLKERRGHAPLHGTKVSLARRFGLGSVATFENRIENEYAHLMDKGEWRGRGDQGVAEVVMKLHPLEAAILQRLRASTNQRALDGRTVPVLAANDIADIARGFGYRDEETLLALQLLAGRGYTRFDAQEKIVYLAQVGPSLPELQARLEQLIEDLGSIPPGLLSEDQQDVIQADLTKAQETCGQASQDEEELDELQTCLNDLDHRLSDALSGRRVELREQANVLTLEVERILIRLRQGDLLDREIHGQVAFVMHLNELRQVLSRDRRKLAKEYADLRGNLERTVQTSGGGPVSETTAIYQTLHESEQTKSHLDQEWG
jgi:hypothetical protein